MSRRFRFSAFRFIAILYDPLFLVGLDSVFFVLVNVVFVSMSICFFFHQREFL